MIFVILFLCHGVTSSSQEGRPQQQIARLQDEIVTLRQRNEALLSTLSQEETPQQVIARLLDENERLAQENGELQFRLGVFQKQTVELGRKLARQQEIRHQDQIKKYREWVSSNIPGMTDDPCRTLSGEAGCRICNKGTNSDASMTEHLMGKDHIRKLSKLERDEPKSTQQCDARIRGLEIKVSEQEQEIRHRGQIIDQLWNRLIERERGTEQADLSVCHPSDTRQDGSAHVEQTMDASEQIESWKIMEDIHRKMDESPPQLL